jgi:methionyl-tRNA formyltransferase
VLDLRIIVLGTGDFALPLFDRLCDTQHNVIALITQPDRPQGRKQELIPSLIKQSALRRNLPVFQPESVNAADSLEQVRELKPDLLVTAAYGQILSADLLTIPHLGGINLHGSILPAYRGAAPVARAIQNGEAESGVTVIRMTPQIDAGGMIAFAKTKIDENETAGELEERLAILGAPLIVDSIAAIVAGTAQVIPQDKSKVTRAPKLRKEDGQIDWSQSASAVHNLVRAMQPWPMASTSWQPREGSSPGLPRVIIHRTRRLPSSTGESHPPGTILEARDDQLVVATGEGSLQVELVQVPGKKPMAAAEFLRGNRVARGDRFA